MGDEGRTPSVGQRQHHRSSSTESSSQLQDWRSSNGTLGLKAGGGTAGLVARKGAARLESGNGAAEQEVTTGATAMTVEWARKTGGYCRPTDGCCHSRTEGCCYIVTETTWTQEWVLAGPRTGTKERVSAKLPTETQEWTLVGPTTSTQEWLLAGLRTLEHTGHRLGP